MVLMQGLKKDWQAGNEYESLKLHKMSNGTIFILTPADDAAAFHGTEAAPGHGNERFALVFRRLELYNKFDTEPPYAMCTEGTGAREVPTHTARFSRSGNRVTTSDWPMTLLHVNIYVNNTLSIYHSSYVPSGGERGLWGGGAGNALI